MLAGYILSIRQTILCQYVNFFKKLRVSPLREVRILANVVGKDQGSVTAGNLAYLKEVFKLDPWTQPMMVFKKMYKGYTVPEVDHWSLPAVEPTQGDGYM